MCSSVVVTGVVGLVFLCSPAIPPAATSAVEGWSTAPVSGAAVAATTTNEAASGPPGAPAGYAAHRLLVAPTAHASQGDLAQVYDRVGGQVQDVLAGGRLRQVRLPDGLPVQEAVHRYGRSDAVRFAEPDFVLQPMQAQTSPNDPGYPWLYGLHNTGEIGGTTPDADIDAPRAWQLTTGATAGPVAVIDTGVAVTHPDLAENIWTNPGEVAGNGIDDDANGYADDVHGWDFYHGDNTVGDGAEDNHGTHVAGTIAAVGNNHLGVTGVNWHAQIMPVKFLGPDGGYTSDAIAALDYAVANGARVSNNSWGGPYDSQALRAAITRADAAGHLMVAAAGNGGSDGLGDNNDLTPDYPASYPHDNIISVAASDADDQLAWFSNYGTTSVDLAAPGVDILSTLTGNTYGYYSGTSMAAPHVTGAAALLLAYQPTLATSDLKNRLLASTDQKESLAATVSGGRLNLRRALGVRAPSTLSLTNQASTVTYGQATTLRGQLTGDARALAGRTVVIEQRPAGSSQWSHAPGGVLTTSTDGTFELSGLRPTQNTDYRAHFAGDEDTDPAVSAILRTNVRPTLTLTTPATDLRLGDNRRVTGRLRPPHDGAIRLIIRRNGAVIARPTLELNDSTYHHSHRPRRAGYYTFTARRSPDHDHLGTRSPTKGYHVLR